MNKKIPLICIVGSGHCGSTVLDMALDSHSKIVGIGEFYQYYYPRQEQEKLICTCGKTVIDCPFWKKVFSKIKPNFTFRVHREKLDFLLNRKRFFEFFEGKINRLINCKEYIKMHEKIYQNVLSVSGKQVIVDSSIDPDRAELLLNSDKLDIVVLHLVRDGRAVTWSYKRKGSAIDGRSRWLFKNLKIELMKKRNKFKSIFVGYEDFCRNPKRCLTRILKIVGLVFEPGMLNFGDKEHHQIGGNRARFVKDSKIELDTSWRKEILLREKLRFNLLCGWLNLIYKYKK